MLQVPPGNWGIYTYFAICYKQDMNKRKPHKSSPGSESRTLKLPPEGEEKLSAVLKYSPSIIMTVDRQMQIQSINRVRAGLTVEGVLGTSCLDYVPPEQRILLETNIKKVFETGESFSYEIQGRGDNSILAWYSTHVSLLNKGKDNEQVLLITEDITERKRAEDELRRSESYFRDLIDCAGDAIYIVNLTDGRILDCNRSACLALGYSRDEIMQLSTTDIEVEVPRDAVESLHAAMRHGVTTHVQGMHRRKDGSIFPVDINLTIMGGPGSRLAVSVVRDITEL